MTVRKSITIDNNEYEIIKEYAKKVGMSFSQFLRQSSLKIIEQEEDLALAKFMEKHLENISLDEQKQIDELNIDFTKKDGKEVTINDFL